MLHPACCSGLPLCFVARAFLYCECVKPVYRQGHVLRIGRLRGCRGRTDADHLELDSFAVEAFGARGGNLVLTLVRQSAVDTAHLVVMISPLSLPRV